MWTFWWSKILSKFSLFMALPYERMQTILSIFIWFGHGWRRKLSRKTRSRKCRGVWNFMLRNFSMQKIFLCEWHLLPLWKLFRLYFSIWSYYWGLYPYHWTYGKSTFSFYIKHNLFFAQNVCFLKLRRFGICFSAKFSKNIILPKWSDFLQICDIHRNSYFVEHMNLKCRGVWNCILQNFSMQKIFLCEWHLLTLWKLSRLYFSI